MAFDFDHRSVTRATKHDWGNGRGSLRIVMESSVVVRDPIYLDFVVITLCLHDWARRVVPGRPATSEQQQPNYYELSPPLRQRWVDHIKELTVNEKAITWLELQVAGLRSFPRIPPPALGFFVQFVSREVGDAARKAVFLEHRTMVVSLDFNVITDMPPEQSAIGSQLPAAPVGRESAACDHGEQSKGKGVESKCCGSGAGCFGPRPNGNGKEEEIDDMCMLSL